MNHAIVPAGLETRVARWYCDLMGYPCPGVGRYVEKNPTDLRAYAIPGWATRYKMPATHPIDGRVAFEIDESITASWEGRKTRGDLDPALVTEFDDFVATAAELPVDWFTDNGDGPQLDQSQDVRPQDDPVLP